jgi:tetratricopeptide (TPR) repeat protein
MRVKSQMSLLAAVGLLVLGCSTVNDVARWHAATARDVVAFVSRVTPARGNLDSHYRLACAYQDRGEHRRAIEEFKKALVLAPDRVKVWNGLGISYDMLGDFPKAIESYRAALRIAPDIDYIQNNLGYSYLLQERFPEAIEAFLKASTLNSRDERYHNNLGLAYGMNAELDKAFEAFKQAGNEMKAYEKLAQICQRKGLPNLAREYQDKARPVVSEAAKAPAGPSAPAYDPSPVKEERAETKEEVLRQERTEVAEQLLPKIDVATAVPAEDLVTKQVPPPVQPGLPPMKAIGIEVSNGNGINQMARKVGDYLAEMGMKVARLTNANKFNQEITKVFYLNGYETEAEYVAEQLPLDKRNLEAVKRFDRPDIRVKVLIGRDLAPYKEVFCQERKQVVATSALTKERP